MSTSGAGGSATYTYDANGNRATRAKSSQTDTYTYDAENRLITLNKQVADPGQTTGTYQYTYDYRTRRVERNESGAGGNVTKVVFSGGLSAFEREGSTNTVEYIRGSDYGGGIGGILYTLRGGTPSYTHYNNRGDVIAKTDDSGSVTYEATYEAFGRRTQENGATSDRQKANTKDEDPTGLLNEGFRYRDLETGAFLTRDPLGFVDGPNMYAYVGQNPWSKFDPLGLAPDVAEYDTFDQALVDSSLDIYHYKPSGNEGNSAQVEYRSDIWKDKNTGKFGYTKPYGIQSPKTTGRRDETKSPENSTYEGTTHNHPTTPASGTRFSSRGDSALNTDGDMGVADTSGKPVGVIGEKNDGTKTPEILKYTPKPEESEAKKRIGYSAEYESRRGQGEVTYYDPKTEQFEKNRPPSGVPTQIGVGRGGAVYEMPDGSTKVVPEEQAETFKRLYEKRPEVVKPEADAVKK